MNGIILLKKMSTEVLYASVHSVAAGHCWFGLERVDVLSEQLGSLNPVQSNQFGLTRRELEIIEAVRRGHTNKTIAGQLSIAQDTIKHHLTNIYNKIGVFTRLQLAVFAIDHQLVHSHKVVEGGTPTTSNTPADGPFSPSEDSCTLPE